jgi:hypothetical protein
VRFQLTKPQVSGRFVLKARSRRRREARTSYGQEAQGERTQQAQMCGPSALYGPAPDAAALTWAVITDPGEAIDDPVTAPGVRIVPAAAGCPAGDREPAMQDEVRDGSLHGVKVDAGLRRQAPQAGRLETRRDYGCAPVGSPQEPVVEVAITDGQTARLADGGMELVAAGSFCCWLARLVKQAGEGEADLGQEFFGRAAVVAVDQRAVMAGGDRERRVPVVIAVEAAGTVGGGFAAAIDAGSAPGRVESGDHPVEGGAHQAASRAAWSRRQRLPRPFEVLHGRHIGA